jgi:hypothetical protein
LVLRLRGGYLPPPEEQAARAKLLEKIEQYRLLRIVKTEMAVSPGGFINQTIVKDPVKAENWDTGNTIMFNLQLLNTSVFEQVTGTKAPSMPIIPELYKRYGYPFFKLSEEKSGVKGDFRGPKSVGAPDQQKGVKRARDEFLCFPIVELNTVDKQRPFLPVSEIGAKVKKLNIVAGF